MPAGSRPNGRVVWLAILFLIVVGSSALRLRLLDVPLDRDEGEYAYMAQLLLEGTPPYAEAYNMKLPGIYLAYAGVLAVFGATPVGIRLGVLVVSAATTVLVFGLGRTLFGPTTGLAAAAAFAALAVNPAFLGFAGYAEHFVLLPGVAGLLLLLHALRTHRRLGLLGAGVLCGLALVVKQHGVFFLGAAVLLVTLAPAPAGSTARRRLAAMALLCAGAAVPYALVCLWLLSHGVFANFWFWTVTYASRYAAVHSALYAPVFVLPTIVPSCVALVALAGLGALALIRTPAVGPGRSFIVLLALASVGAASVGFYFREHYFLLTLPALALLVGLGTEWLARRPLAMLGPKAGAAAAGILALAIAQSLYAERAVLFRLSPEGVARAVFGFNPFPEAIAIGRYLRERTAPGDRIAVLGSEPEIYFYAGRRAATGYIYTYPLVEEQPYALRMQREMIAEIERAAPSHLIAVNVQTSWLEKPGSPRLLFEWFARYRQAHLEPVGIIDIVSLDRTEYRWDAGVQGYTPQTGSWLVVYRRRG